MANIISMAGTGSRFSKEGYILPKPLIPVSGIPMIVKAIENMPRSGKWIFIVRKEYINNYKIDEIIKTKIPDAIIIPVEKNTEGQACTCMLAQPYLNPEEPIFIGACDNTYLYDKKKFEELCKNPKIDCVVFTFTEREILRKNPNSFGWCKLKNGDISIEDVSVKVPISDNPYKDHAVVASFYFKKARDFIDAVNLMVEENFRINNEFYVDAIPKFLSRFGKKSVIFDVDLLVLWGTPSDLHDYDRNEYIVKHNVSLKKMTEEEEKFLPLWRKYFQNKN